VRASHDVLVELFERIESFFKRLGVYTRISLTTEMEEVFVKIVAEVLSILSIATKEVRRTGASALLLQDILYTGISCLISDILPETIGKNGY
jgi:hypothetical protein